ncbi:hypothetical protein HMPREF0083_03058 [Aneurinibacillus aneurinilyticus ATCC 12856]|uniref:Uncharacterized protein n=1 Tax=Aneurinibacillus aneurinilyticus ATCC 12856 TaxID=649747 RepID=U1YDL4_ANEAE|nr:hypothetical protein HMPREF0083_03058 [Aneurinibacillus aneurinilyticus ATCC 12856]
MVGRKRFGKKKRLGTPCALAEEMPRCLFPTAPAHRPSSFSYLPSQTCVDLSNQIYIIRVMCKALKISRSTYYQSLQKNRISS